MPGHDAPLRAIDFDDFSAEVLKLYRPPMRRRGTFDKTRQVLAELSTYCPTTADLGPAAIADWITAHSARAPSTIEGLLRHLSAVCTYGELKGYLRDPFHFRAVSSWLPADELIEDEELFRRHRSAAEIAHVLAQADAEVLGGGWEARRLRVAVYCWAYTGASRNEILGLRIRDIDLSRRLLTIRSHARRRLKTRARAARLPIASALGTVLEEWIPHCGCEWLIPGARRSGPWLTGSGPRRPIEQVRALGERAGVPGLTILAFRHTVGTLAEGWGIGELMLQRILRHARRRTQDHYRHPDMELMRQAAELIHFG